MNEDFAKIADSYLDHIIIAVMAGDHGAPFRTFLDNWSAFQPASRHHLGRGGRVRWFNNPSALNRAEMLKGLDFHSVGACDIINEAGTCREDYRRRRAEGDAEVRLIVDHAVPINIIAGMLFDVAADGTGDFDRPNVRACLNDWYKLGLLSHRENALLDSKGLSSKMPLDWDGKTLFARYSAVGIVEAVREVPGPATIA